LLYCEASFLGGIMRTFACVAIMLVTVALSVPFAGTAFAQAGSTGGTLGNTDKSISGDREAPRHEREEPRKKAAPKEASHTASGSSCGNIVGTWKWYFGLSQTTYLADGTSRNTFGTTGTWQCAGNAISGEWSNGSVKEHYVLSPDGDILFVHSSWGGGVSFAATREGH
jgi:hypothetical protein